MQSKDVRRFGVFCYVFRQGLKAQLHFKVSMVLAPMLIEASLWLAATMPFARHWLAMRNWDKIELQYPENPKIESDKCVILLPVWNESLIIEKKLRNLSNQFAGPYHLIIIDSNSTDNTVSLCNEWIDNNSNAFSSFQLIEMPVRLGKTTAVAAAIDEIQAENNFEYILLH